MSHLYTELLVPRKTPGSAKFLKVLLIVLTVFAGLLGFTFMPLALIVFVGLIVLCYFKLPSFDLEFEYLYVNGELDVDKIMSKTKRKRVARIDMDKVELIAPLKSHELDYYRNNNQIKVQDYSSGEEDHNIYAMILNGEKGMQMIYFEPNDVILNDMKRIAPRKVKTM